jgi:hypothetical protein
MMTKESGTIKVLFDKTSGVSKAGNNWTAREFVLETRDGDFLTDLHFKAFGRDVDALEGAKVGDTIEVTYKPASREYNGRWYDELRLFGVVNMSATSAPAMKAEAPAEIPVDDDIPF